MTALSTLVAARELLSVPERWTKGANARTASGQHVCFSDQTPVCFCLDGALQHVARAAEATIAAGFLNAALSASAAGYSFVSWQDAPERTHAEVLALLDKSIELAKSREVST